MEGFLIPHSFCTHSVSVREWLGYKKSVCHHHSVLGYHNREKFLETYEMSRLYFLLFLGEVRQKVQTHPPVKLAE